MKKVKKQGWLKIAKYIEKDLDILIKRFNDYKAQNPRFQKSKKMALAIIENK